MTKVLKALFGSELRELDSYTIDNDRLFADETIDLSLKDLAKGVLQQAEQEIATRNFKPRDSAIYRRDIARKVNNILKSGQVNYSESMLEDPQKNAFGYYSKYDDSFPAMVNLTVEQAVNNGNQSKATAVELANPIQAKIRPFAYFKPTEGFNIYQMDNETRGSKTKKFASELYRTLSNFIKKGYTSDNSVLQDIAEDALPELNQYASDLNMISLKANITDNDTLKLANIISRLNNSDLSDLFENYFEVENGIIGGSAAAKAKAEVAAQEAAAAEAGQYADYLSAELPDKSHIYVQMDPTKDDYRHAIITNGTTSTSYDLTKQEDINKLNDLGLWENLSAYIKEFNKKFAPKDYTGYGLGHVTDFSNYFTDEDPNNREIVSINWDDYPDLKFDDQLFIPFDKLFPDWETRKARFRFKGNADVDASGKDMNNLWSLSESIPDIDFGEVQDLTDQDIINKYAGKADDNGQINNTTGTFHKDKSFTDLFENSTVSGNFQQKMAVFIGAYCLALENPEVNGPIIDSMFPNFTFKTKNGDELGEAVMKQILSNSAEAKSLFKYAITHAPNAEYRKAIAKVYKEQVSKLEKGGVLKMFKGSAFNTDRNESVVLSNTNSDVSKEDLITGAVIMGCGIALDAISLFDKEPLSSGILGTVPMVTNLVANHYWKTPTGEKLTDLGLDATSAVLGFIPWINKKTKSAKVSADLAKLGKILGTSSAIAGPVLTTLGIVDTADLKLFKKCAQKGFTSLTPEEVKQMENIFRGIAMNAGGIMGAIKGARNPATKTVKEGYVKAKNKNTGEISYVKIDPEIGPTAIKTRDNALETLHFWNAKLKNEAHTQFLKGVLGDAYIPVTKGKIIEKEITAPDYGLNPEKMLYVQGYELKNPKTAQKLGVTSENYQNKTWDPNTSKWQKFVDFFSNLMPNFKHWGANYPVLYNKQIKLNDPSGVEKEITLLGLPKSTHRTLLELYKIKELQDSNILSTETLSDDIKKIVGNNKVYLTTDRAGQPLLVYVDEKRKNGGKLLHLQNYVKQNGKLDY